jgi:hypothetical protein
MNKNISFSQYKELYLSPHNQENDITNLKQDTTNDDWGFYTSLEPIKIMPQIIDEINDSMVDDFYPNPNQNPSTNPCNYLLQILPLCIMVFFII